MNNMNYFVTVDGTEVASNLTKTQAMHIADKKSKETKNSLKIGIGKIKYIRGERVYTCLPMHFYNA